VGYVPPHLLVNSLTDWGGGGGQGKPPLKTYALNIEQLRDPQQNSAMSHPYNAYPTSAVQASVVEWEDGMQTFCYALKGREDIVVKHVFTGNTPVLQKDADNFLKEIQLEVPMERLRRNTSESLLDLFRLSFLMITFQILTFRTRRGR